MVFSIEPRSALMPGSKDIACSSLSRFRRRMMKMARMIIMTRATTPTMAKTAPMAALFSRNELVEGVISVGLLVGLTTTVMVLPPDVVT